MKISLAITVTWLRVRQVMYVFQGGFWLAPVWLLDHVIIIIVAAVRSQSAIR